MVWGNWDTHHDSGMIVSKFKGITIYFPAFKMSMHDDKNKGMRCLTGIFIVDLPINNNYKIIDDLVMIGYFI